MTVTPLCKDAMMPRASLGSARRIVAYRRVSTQKQGQSGLGLEAQSEAIAAYAERIGATVLETFTEVESGKRNDRPELGKAIHLAKVTGATLVIAKLDRLSRNAAFLLTLRDAGVDFEAADMPDANTLTIGIMALVAQQEREAASRRTREALQAAKRRGVRLGNPNGASALQRAGKGNSASREAAAANAANKAADLRPVLEAVIDGGCSSLSGIATEFNRRGIKTTSGGGSIWYPSSISNLLTRLGMALPLGHLRKAKGV
jgi:DNA invertase Pin-like site-specific DNA recombinase